MYPLSGQERVILTLRRDKNLTLDEVAKEMGLGRERVRQIQKKAEEKIIQNHINNYIIHYHV